MARTARTGGGGGTGGTGRSHGRSLSQPRPAETAPAQGRPTRLILRFSRRQERRLDLEGVFSGGGGGHGQKDPAGKKVYLLV